MLYVDARDDGGGIAVIEDQELVTDDGEVKIVALQNEFRRSGTGQVTLELRPTENVTETLPEGDLTVTLPTRLSGDNWRDKTDLPTDNGIYGGVTDDTNDDGVYNLTLNTTADNLTVDTVGVQETPEDPTQNDDGAAGGGLGNEDPNLGGQAPPEFSSIDVSSSGDSNKNNKLTFTYSTTDDATGVTLFAQTDKQNELVNDNAAPTDGSAGETYTFSDINMKSRDIDIEMTVRNAEGDSRTCTGTITTQGGSVEKNEMQCSID
ncbi:hypothetical protein [Halorubrum salsamenti]|uniref:hypothetical protein n=1 Tax=Halorubrum salsamenti TaxID=2583990 RepID=UPI0011A2645F|nr:hypothetical protein [Halorubrum salsamenti]